MEYQPIVSATSGVLKVTALVGTNTAILGFDLRGGMEQHAGLLGFAVRRVNLMDGTEEWLKNPLKFRSAPHEDRFNIAGTPTNLAPIQQFHWGDHRLDNSAGVAYRYEVSALYDDPQDPRPRGQPTAIVVVPAPNTAPGPDRALSLYFNRGVVATPAYRQQFDNQRPGRKGVATMLEAQRYLSRGLWEALLGFIGGAQPGDELCVAIYEFRHQSVVEELQRAIDRGVKVRLIYHARAGEAADRTGEENLASVARLRPAPATDLPPPEIKPRRNVRGLSHNKFILHKRAGAPAQIWTGSTNFTDAGFFLQTNVGIVLQAPEIIRAYADYFELLFADAATAALQPAIGGMALRFDGLAIPQLFFSPVAGDALLETAAEMIRGARDVVLISCPFGLEHDGVILQAIKALDRRVLVCGLLNTNQRGDLVTLDADSHDTQEFAVPDWIKQLNGEAYDASVGQGNQVHVKSLVVDPWGERPRVLIGSANFSGESVNDNDENALLIDGDRWAAAVVATEFLRAFEHYKFRNFIRLIAEQVDTQERPAERAFGGWAGGILGAADEQSEEWFLDLDGLGAPATVQRAGPGQGGVLGAVERADYWLAEDDAWAAAYFEDGSPRRREREVFAP